MNRRLTVALAAIFAVATAVASHHANATTFRPTTSSLMPVPLCNPDVQTCPIGGKPGK